MKCYSTLYRIARYERDQEGKFQFTHWEDYEINYRLVNRSKAPHTRKNTKQLQIIVNGFLTPFKLVPQEIVRHREFPRKIIREAVSMYYNHKNALQEDISKISDEALNLNFSVGFRDMLKRDIFITKKLICRDTITKCKLLPKES